MVTLAVVMEDTGLFVVYVTPWNSIQLEKLIIIIHFCLATGPWSLPN
jgi:hypothetical protein